MRKYIFGAGAGAAFPAMAETVRQQQNAALQFCQEHISDPQCQPHIMNPIVVILIWVSILFSIGVFITLMLWAYNRI